MNYRTVERAGSRAEHDEHSTSADAENLDGSAAGSMKKKDRVAEESETRELINETATFRQQEAVTWKL